MTNAGKDTLDSEGGGRQPNEITGASRPGEKLTRATAKLSQEERDMNHGQQISKL